MKNYGTRDVLTPAGVRFLATIAALKSKPYVKVGVTQDKFNLPKKGESGSKPTTLGIVATANEFGTDRIPERSFIRSTHDENWPKWRQTAEELRQAIMFSRRTTDWALKYMGQVIKTAIQDKIRSHVPPPNAPATVKRKKSSATLIDTGQLLNSINYEVHRKGDE